MKTVVIALSGGVDSAVAAYLLKKKYKVIALFMQNWESDCSDQDYKDVILISKILEIPFYKVNFSKEYKSLVFNDCIKDFERGLTPNPDIGCNSQIKFKLLLKKAIEELGADYLATGHYCQIKNNKLFRGYDLGKDQSYFLYAIDKEVLPKVLFPIGGMTKTRVRQIAREVGLPVHNKKDSYGICFIGEKRFGDFLSKFIKDKEGDIVSQDGKKLSKHKGLFFYTIGQRKGLGLGGQGEPWYVVGKDIPQNQLIVARGSKNKQLLNQKLITRDLNWISKPHFVNEIFQCSAQVRYRQCEQLCTIKELNDEELEVYFNKAQLAIAPGQSIVFYEGNQCLGGGIIKKAID